MNAPRAVQGPRWLYLHGFASGPQSSKGVALSEHYSRRGIALERLNLRVPSLEHLRFSAMKRVVHDAIGGPSDRAIVFGSSLGALTACRVAEEDARICALVLLAPAFRISPRWRVRLGEEAWRRWEETDALEIDDYAEKRRTTVDYGFIRELESLEAHGDGWPDVRVPTLIVHGVNDDVALIDNARTWAAGKRHVRLVEVDDGHELVASLARIADEADAFLAGFTNGA
ncbi:YqiA/YcfP family alpha/beta fold hydrolase [Pendulispora albinea]|uniref:Alpha/beta fold hydrolase n=1 Tax=Pendulispora albinea TaxID=2741071 RepID=A0ABZ2M6Q9_9BACT